MSVWIMNLKDNREGTTAEGTEKKFAFCKEKGILGIGWVGYEEKESEDLGLKRAKNAIMRFKPNDLVWVRNSTAKKGEPKRYICKVSAPAVTTSDAEFNNLDIGRFCYAEFYPIESVPDGISNRELVSRRTVSAANENVSIITERYRDFLLRNG